MPSLSVLNRRYEKGRKWTRDQYLRLLVPSQLPLIAFSRPTNVGDNFVSVSFEGAKGVELRKIAALLVAASLAVPVYAQTNDSSVKQRAMLDRAKAAELPGSWMPAPVDKLSHAAATFAQRVCSAVFILA